MWKKRKVRLVEKNGIIYCRIMAIYFLLIAAANIIWGGSFSVMKWGLADISPLTFAFYRFFFSAVILWAIVLATKRNEIKKLSWKLLLNIMLVGMLDISYHLGCFVGLELTSAADTAIIASMEPVFLFFLATIILRERFKVRHVISLVLALVGFCVLSDLFSFRPSSFTDKLFVGNLIIFFAANLEALFSVLLKPLGEKVSPILLIAIISFTQSVIMFPIARCFDPQIISHIFNFKALTAVIYLSVFCTVFGYSVWLLAMKKMPVNVMAISLFLQPVSGPLIAALFLGERLDIDVLVGGVFIVLALYIVISRGFHSRVRGVINSSSGT